MIYFYFFGQYFFWIIFMIPWVWILIRFPFPRFPYLVLYQFHDFIDNFTLYLSIDNLKGLFSENAFISLFWIHFISINLFCGGWVVKDSHKYLVPKYLIFVPLLLIYFVGPLGIFIYWVIRIFYAKKINLYE